MRMAKKQGTWGQCTKCGNIDFLDISVPIDVLYIASTCKKCKNHKMLNCGNNKVIKINTEIYNNLNNQYPF